MTTDISSPHTSSSQALFQKALFFAAQKHADAGQVMKTGNGNVPYIVHCANVAMELFVAARHSNPALPSTMFDVDFAVQVAYLHDTLEDTKTDYIELDRIFGTDIASGVLALTKNVTIPKDLRIEDCLKRIIQHPKEVWMVKMADRITNLQRPPDGWSESKCTSYMVEAMDILHKLKFANEFLAVRLDKAIAEYTLFIRTRENTPAPCGRG